MMVACVICQLQIKEKKDNYYKVELYSEGKLVGTDYAHQKCWLDKFSLNRDINNLVQGLSHFAVKNNLIEPKVITL